MRSGDQRDFENQAEVVVSLDILRTPEERERLTNLIECVNVAGQELIARALLIPT
ncbi:MAG: hypothetical protein UY76_C0031G0001, partial [Candidatus Uhrbacteria bacterium GW2011_GWA2_52_8d]